MSKSNAKADKNATTAPLAINRPTSYEPGELVFAKVDGCSPWPARVERVSNEPEVEPKYHIIFFGTYASSVLGADALWPYELYKHLFGKSVVVKRGRRSKKAIAFAEALAQIETAKVDSHDLSSATPGSMAIAGVTGDSASAEKTNDGMDDGATSGKRGVITFTPGGRKAIDKSNKDTKTAAKKRKSAASTSTGKRRYFTPLADSSKAKLTGSETNNGVIIQTQAKSGEAVAKAITAGGRMPSTNVVKAAAVDKGEMRTSKNSGNDQISFASEPAARTQEQAPDSPIVRPLWKGKFLISLLRRDVHSPESSNATPGTANATTSVDGQQQMSIPLVAEPGKQASPEEFAESTSTHSELSDSATTDAAEALLHLSEYRSLPLKYSRNDHWQQQQSVHYRPAPPLTDPSGNDGRYRHDESDLESTSEPLDLSIKGRYRHEQILDMISSAQRSQQSSLLAAHSFDTLTTFPTPYSHIPSASSFSAPSYMAPTLLPSTQSSPAFVHKQISTEPLPMMTTTAERQQETFADFHYTAHEQQYAAAPSSLIIDSQLLSPAAASTYPTGQFISPTSVADPIWNHGAKHWNPKRLHYDQKVQSAFTFSNAAEPFGTARETTAHLDQHGNRFDSAVNINDHSVDQSIVTTPSIVNEMKSIQTHSVEQPWRTQNGGDPLESMQHDADAVKMSPTSHIIQDHQDIPFIENSRALNPTRGEAARPKLVEYDDSSSSDRSDADSENSTPSQRLPFPASAIAGATGLHNLSQPSVVGVSHCSSGISAADGGADVHQLGEANGGLVADGDRDSSGDDSDDTADEETQIKGEGCRCVLAYDGRKDGRATFRYVCNPRIESRQLSTVGELAITDTASVTTTSVRLPQH